MATPSLDANNKPSWPIRFFKRLNPFASRIEPELYEQSQGGPKMTRWGIIKGAGGKFAEFDDSNSMAIYRPSGGKHIDPAKALANNRGYVYAAVNAIARDVMNIEWRLFQVTGRDHEEQMEHEALDLLDSVNDYMTGAELK